MIKIVTEKIKKNILDLNFQKYLVMVSTSIIVAFTYFIGVGIALLTKQIMFNNTVAMIILGIFSVAILGSCAFFFFKGLTNIESILKLIKDLKLN